MCTLQIRFGVLRMLCRNLQEQRNNKRCTMQNKTNPRAQICLSALDSVLPCGGCERLWVCACLCGLPLRYATPPPRSRGTCLARAVDASLVTLIHCHSSRAPSRVYKRTLVYDRSLARSKMTNLWVRFKVANGNTNTHTDKVRKLI